MSAAPEIKTIPANARRPWASAMAELDSTQRFAEVVAKLARSDCWFEVMPLGDDRFRVMVKEDTKQALVEALVEVVTIDLNEESFRALLQAASESNWIPPEYCCNDWVSDCCNWLRNGPPADPGEVKALVRTLQDVSRQFRLFGNSMPDGFDGRLFRQVKDALAPYGDGAAQSQADASGEASTPRIRG